MNFAARAGRADLTGENNATFECKTDGFPLVSNET